MNTRIPIFSNDFIKKVVSYCISLNPDGTPNMNFWSASLFQYLIEKNLLSDSYVKDGIVKAFIERNSWVNFKISLFLKKMLISLFYLLTEFHKLIGYNETCYNSCYRYT